MSGKRPNIVCLCVRERAHTHTHTLECEGGWRKGHFEQRRAPPTYIGKAKRLCQALR